MRNICALVFLLLCGSTHAASPESTPISVLASFTILADWVREIGGKHVVVESIVGLDEDPHVFTPTPETVKQVMRSDIIFFNGLGLEGWWPRLLNASKYQGDVVTVAQALHVHLHPHTCSCGHHDPHDPHVWHTVPNARKYVRVIRDSLIKRMPGKKAYFMNRWKRYMKKLARLETFILARIKTVPVKKRVVITAHDAFSYLAHWLHLTIKAPSGLSTDSEPSSKDVAALVDLIRANNIRALFLENMTNPRIMKQLSRETNVKIVGELCSDALSRKYATTYIAMMRHNIEIMVKAMKLNG